MRGANGTFCAGGDIKGFKAMFKSAAPKPGEKDRRRARTIASSAAFMTRFEALPQTIVMVVEGAAFGGGLGLLCARRRGAGGRGREIRHVGNRRSAFRRRRSRRSSRRASALRARAACR